MRYVLSLGTNIGDRKNNLLSAVKSLELIPETKVLDCSSIYETEPVGYAQQDDFYNIALLLESKFEPNEMLGICMGLEAGFNRVREFKNGPRILDVDVIFCEDKKISTKILPFRTRDILSDALFWSLCLNCFPTANFRH